MSEYSYDYYNNNLELSKTDITGKTVTYTYDGAGRLKRAMDDISQIVYTYDKAGNRVWSTKYYCTDVLIGDTEFLSAEEMEFKDETIIEVEPDDQFEVNFDDYEDIMGLEHETDIETHPQTVNLGGRNITYDYLTTNYLYDKANRLVGYKETYSEDSTTSSIIKASKNVRYVFDDAGNQISTAAEYPKLRQIIKRLSVRF